MAERIPQSVAIRVPLMTFLSADHVTPAGSVTVAVTISKNGGAFGNLNAGATNATVADTGLQYVDLDTTDTGTVGPLVVRGTSATIDNVYALYNVVAFVDQTGDSFARIGAAGAGLTAVGDTAGTTTLLTRVPSAITVSGGIVSADIKKVNATAVTGSGTAGVPWGP